VERGAKIATAAGVLMIGLSMALFFRHDGSRIGATSPDGFDHLVLRGRMEPDSPIAPAASPIPPDVAGRTSSGVHATSKPRAAEESSRKAAESTSRVAPSPWTSSPYSSQWSTLGSTTAEWKKTLRRHKINDGDTLAGLAERYLGAADRANEIFDLNREILPSPELLPIGKEIKIPPREKPGAPRNANAGPHLVPAPSQAVRS